MTPTQVSPDPDKFAPVVLDRMAGIMMAEYEGLFFKAYSRALVLRGERRPFEPMDEMRNAFDHFSQAARGAFEIDGRNAEVPRNPRNRAMPKEKAALSPKERAFLDLNQGRRHLAIGRYFRALHEIIGYRDRIEQAFARMSRKKPSAPMRKRAAELYDRLGGIRPIEIETIHSSAKIEIWLRDFEVKIDEVRRLVAELGRLLRDIGGPTDRRRAS